MGGGVINRLSLNKLCEYISSNVAAKLTMPSMTVSDDSYSTGQELLDILHNWKLSLPSTTVQASIKVIGNISKIKNITQYLDTAVNDEIQIINFTLMSVTNQNYYTLLGVSGESPVAFLLSHRSSGTIWTVKNFTLA